MTDILRCKQSIMDNDKPKGRERNNMGTKNGHMDTWTDNNRTITSQLFSAWIGPFLDGVVQPQKYRISPNRELQQQHNSNEKGGSEVRQFCCTHRSSLASCVSRGVPGWLGKQQTKESCWQIHPQLARNITVVLPYPTKRPSLSFSSHSTVSVVWARKLAS